MGDDGNLDLHPSFSSEGSCKKEVKEMEVVRTKTLEEITNWRDEMLIRLLKLMREE